ncbi:4'-phosphopantetheinyl transferase family protein [Streptomyces sp. NPDC053367]|uniref:4'-phosphopantetheinyl transferase family protein n=1 Tax=Streptomyces sp. NPDC053367 TaxID=3365700 RepID=UPI0037D1A15C
MPSGTNTGAAAAVAVVAGTDEVLAHPEADERLLEPAERVRAARFRHESARRDFVAAHLLARICAGLLLDVGPAAVALAQHCDDCAEDGHGKPYLPDHPTAQVSMAHTPGVVAAAAGAATVGIDVELTARRPATPALLERALSGNELRLLGRHGDPQATFLRQWVRKEALVKAGRADLGALYELDLSGMRLGPRRHFGGDAAWVQDGRFEQFHVLDLADERRGVLASVVSGTPVRLTALSVTAETGAVPPSSAEPSSAELSSFEPTSFEPSSAKPSSAEPPSAEPTSFEPSSA